MGAKRFVATSAMAMALGAMCAGAVLPGIAIAKEPKQRSAKDPKARRICRNVTPTGSRMPTRICRSEQQWNEIQDETSDGVLQFQMKEQTTYTQVPG